MFVVCFRVVELTGDVAPDMQAVARADVIVTTPEKWDGISRSWQTRSYVKAVTLLVIDEIHLLGITWFFVMFHSVISYLHRFLRYLWRPCLSYGDSVKTPVEQQPRAAAAVSLEHIFL